jgi:citrate lyase beta subunit
MERNITGYDVGALIYSPANGPCDIAKKLKEEQFGKPFSLAFCLEDTVADDAVEQAEEALYQKLEQIEKAVTEAEFYMPLIFIRIRTP